MAPRKPHRIGPFPRQKLLVNRITIGAAKILGIADRVGLLDSGKDGDMVLFDGNPFEYTTDVEAVLVSGRVSYRREQ